MRCYDCVCVYVGMAGGCILRMYGSCRQGSSLIPVFGDGRPSINGMLVKPQPTWRDILLSPEAVDWLIALLKALQGRPDSALAAASRQLLVCAPACPHEITMLSCCIGS